MDNKTRHTIITDAKKYTIDEYELWQAEHGWQDWMNEYTEAEEGEPATDKEIEIMNKIMRECWDIAHR